MVNRKDSAQFQLRLPPDLRDRIKRAGDANGLSMNAEIVRALEREFPPPTDHTKTLREILDLAATLRLSEKSGPLRDLADSLVSSLSVATFQELHEADLGKEHFDVAELREALYKHERAAQRQQDVDDLDEFDEKRRDDPPAPPLFLRPIASDDNS